MPALSAGEESAKSKNRIDIRKNASKKEYRDMKELKAVANKLE